MNGQATKIPDVFVFEPKVFGDERGYFFESFQQQRFEQSVGQEVRFVQDNQSKSTKGVLRGLHYQIGRRPQGKLVRVTHGEILDVAVDIRRNSNTFGQWVSARLSASNFRQLWIPAGFAHGFVTLSDEAVVQYKATDFYDPEGERCIIWNDPSLAIDWEYDGDPLLSGKDQLGLPLRAAECFES